jgi:hypothetical protein
MTRRAKGVDVLVIVEVEELKKLASHINRMNM